MGLSLDSPKELINRPLWTRRLLAGENGFLSGIFPKESYLGSSEARSALSAETDRIGR